VSIQLVNITKSKQPKVNNEKIYVSQVRFSAENEKKYSPGSVVYKTIARNEVSLWKGNTVDQT